MRCKPGVVDGHFQLRLPNHATPKLGLPVAQISQAASAPAATSYGTLTGTRARWMPSHMASGFGMRPILETISVRY